MNETFNPLSRKAFVFSLLPPLCFETRTIWRNLCYSGWLLLHSHWLRDCHRIFGFLIGALDCASCCIHWCRTHGLYNLWLHALRLDFRNICVASSLLRIDHSHSCSWIVDISQFYECNLLVGSDHFAFASFPSWSNLHCFWTVPSFCLESWKPFMHECHPR